MPNNQADWAKLLDEALREPGKISEAYRKFRGYSLGNQLCALIQCSMRGIEPGPIASFNRWKELGRHVKKGEKAISLCMPISGRRTKKDSDGNEEIESYRFFAFRNNWFVLSQTEGEEYTPEPLPAWDEARALAALNIERVPFDVVNGNVHGFAAPGRKIAVSPLAEMPHKTLFHELGHQVLGHLPETESAPALSDSEHIAHNLKEVEAEAVAMLCCASLGLPGVEYSRGYIQNWADGEPIGSKTAARVFAAADKILRAGMPKDSRESN